MSSTDHVMRVPAGTPGGTGGQFATTGLHDADVTLQPGSGHVPDPGTACALDALERARDRMHNATGGTDRHVFAMAYEYTRCLDVAMRLNPDLTEETTLSGEDLREMGGVVCRASLDELRKVAAADPRLLTDEQRAAAIRLFADEAHRSGPGARYRSASDGTREACRDVIADLGADDDKGIADGILGTLERLREQNNGRFLTADGTLDTVNRWRAAYRLTRLPGQR